MSRRRVADKSVPVSVAIPQSLLNRLNTQLDWKQSRSLWVQQAIKAKLDAHDDESQVISSMSSHRLIVILFNRNVINWEMYDLLKSMLPTEETEAEQ